MRNKTQIVLPHTLQLMYNAMPKPAINISLFVYFRSCTYTLRGSALGKESTSEWSGIYTHIFKPCRSRGGFIGDIIIAELVQSGSAAAVWSEAIG